MSLVFTSLARLELDDAVAYFEAESLGLGSRFKKEVRLALHRIAAFSQAWAVERGEIRRYVMHRFPYKILYAVEPNRILIIAVAHQHRRPSYWVDGEPDQENAD